HLERQRFGSWSAVEEVAWRVNMRATVRAQVQCRDVRAVAAGDALDSLEAERHVIRIGRQRGIERDRNVDELHEGTGTIRRLPDARKGADDSTAAQRAKLTEVLRAEGFDLARKRRL